MLTWVSAYDKKKCGGRDCTAELTRDSDLSPSSRWSCKYSLTHAPCEIRYGFKEAQDVAKLAIAFYKGDKRKRSFSVMTLSVEGDRSFTFTSSGDTLGYQEFELDSTGVIELLIMPTDSKRWFGITEVNGYATMIV